MKDKILEIIQRNGPVVPTDITQELSINSMIASAYLSELVSSKKLVISHLKFGGSPLYYLPNDKKRLEQYAEKLHPQEKEAFNILKEKKVVQESTLAPAQRVAMRNVKDFAIPLEVTFKDHKEIFWKWYELSNEQVSERIKQLLGEKKEPEVERRAETTPIERTPERQEEKPKEPTPPPPIKEEREEPEKTKEPEKETPPKKEEKKEVKEVKKAPPKETQQTFTPEDPFLKEVVHFLTKNDIRIVSAEVDRAKSEAHLVVQIPSVLGALNYFVKAKKKKRLNEQDLTQAYAEGSLQKLPPVLLSPGTLTKKAEEKREKDLKSVLFVQMQ